MTNFCWPIWYVLESLLSELKKHLYKWLSTCSLIISCSPYDYDHFWKNNPDGQTESETGRITQKLEGSMISKSWKLQWTRILFRTVCVLVEILMCKGFDEIIIMLPNMNKTTGSLVSYQFVQRTLETFKVLTCRVHQGLYPKLGTMNKICSWK